MMSQAHRDEPAPQTVPLRQILAEDLSRYLNQSDEHRAAGNTLKTRVSAWLSIPLQSVLLYRISHWLWLWDMQRSARMVSQLNTLLFKATISPGACIGPGFFLPHPPCTGFCGRAGRGFTMYSIVTCWPELEDGCDVNCGPQIGDDVTIGGHVVILGPVRIGRGTKVGYSTAMKRDAPEGVVVISRAMRSSRSPLAGDFTHGRALEVKPEGDLEPGKKQE